MNNIHFIEMKKFKTTSITVTIHSELNKESSTMNALLPLVLKQGNALYKSAREISAHLNDMYGASFNAWISKIGESQNINFSISTINDEYTEGNESIVSDMTEFLMDMIYNPLIIENGFKEEYVNTEKNNLRNKIMARINNKKEYAIDRCIHVMCENQRYAVSEYGYIENLDKVTAKELYEHYKKIIKNKTDVVVCGTFDKDKVLKSAGKYCAKTNHYIPKTDMFISGGYKEVTEAMDISQSKLCIGLYTGLTLRDENYIPLIVANSIFGGGAHSKLFNNVREKYSLAYYVYSNLDSVKGVMFINAGIDKAQLSLAKSEIIKQLNAVKENDFTDDELSIAKLALTNSYMGIKDSKYYSSEFKIKELTYGYDRTVDEFIEKINRVSREDVLRSIQNVKIDTLYLLEGNGGAE